MRNLKKPIDIILLDEAEKYYYSLSEKCQIKLLKSFDKTKEGIKSKWFKYLGDEIWEFKDKDQNKFIRLLAFWDKTRDKETLIIATHGFDKKTNKTPKNQINKAKRIKDTYFENKLK